MPTLSTQQKVTTQLAIIRAVAETIQETLRCPAGPLYVGLMTHGCTFTQFEQVIDILRGAKLIRREGDELVWIGPAKV